MVLVLALQVPEITIHSSWITEIIGSKTAQVAAFKENKVFTKVLIKYSDFKNIFSEENALMLPEKTDFNEHAIKLESEK